MSAEREALELARSVFVTVPGYSRWMPWGAKAHAAIRKIDAALAGTEGPTDAEVEDAAEGHFHAEQFSTALDNPDRMAVSWSELPDREKAVRRQVMHFALTAANTPKGG